jgi:hypothetical protein
MSILNALKSSVTGNFEINRLIGGIGGLVFIVSTTFFVWYEVVWKGGSFDITAYCLAFPGGIAGIVGGTAGAVALKDRNVASATITAQTGAIPAKPPEGPQVPVSEPELSPAAAAAGSPRPLPRPPAPPVAPPPPPVVGEPANL